MAPALLLGGGVHEARGQGGQGHRQRVCRAEGAQQHQSCPSTRLARLPTRGAGALDALLAEKGYDEKMGARPMQRLIQDRIKKELAEDILFGKLSRNGGPVLVDVEDEDLILVVGEPETV